MNDYEDHLTKNTVVQQQANNDLGIISFALGFVSIFFLAPLFVPIALTLGIIAVCKKQLAWGLAGIICSLIGFITSPILLAMLGLAVLSSTDNLSLPSISQPSVSSPNTSTPLPEFLQKFAPMLENIGTTIEREIKSLDTSSQNTSPSSTTQKPVTDTTLPLPAGFLKAYPEYLAKAEKKAIALAHDRDGRYAWGYGYNYSTQELADARALSECRSRMTEYKVENDCKLYAIGNRVIW